MDLSSDLAVEDTTADAVELNLVIGLTLGQRENRDLPIIQAPFGTNGSRVTALAVRVGSGHKEPSSDPGPNNLLWQECQ